jgi:hypothetical protein
MKLSVGRFGAGLALVSLILGTGVGVGIEALGEGPAGAATTITVNDPVDSGTLAPGNCTSAPETDCTLRSAIDAFNNADSDMTIDLPDPSTLTPAQAFYNVDSNNGNLTIGSNAGNPNTLTISYTGTIAPNGVIEADKGTDPSTDINVFQIDGDTTAIISGVTIQDGDNTGGDGGGILNEGNLQLVDSAVTANTTSSNGGGIAQEQSSIEGSAAPSMTLTSDTISVNSASGGDGGGVYADGGTTTLDGTDVNDANTASGGGGGISVVGQSASATSVTVEDGSEIDGNTTNNSGGGIDITGANNLDTVVDVENSTVSSNSVGDEDSGAGISQDVESTLTVSNTTISANGPSAGQNVFIEGGGVALQGAGSADTFTDDTIDGNNQAFDGAGVYIDNVDPTFTGGTISGNAAVSGGGGVYLEGGTNSFTGVTIENNTAGVADTENGNGGGIFAASGTNTFTDDTVNDNDAVWVNGDDGYGGGLDVTGGTVTFTGGSLESNSAYGGGGVAIFGGTINISQAAISSNDVTEGAGGVLLDGGIASISQSTISNNAVTEEIGVTEFVGDGGGIVSDFCNPLTLTDDTIANNSASLLGGGYFGTACTTVSLDRPATAGPATSHVEPSSADTTFLFDTIAGNSAGEGGGNINTDDESTLAIGESIVANGVSGGVEGDNCTFTDGGTLTSLGYNLIDDSTCGTPGTGDIIGQGAQLGALANNGGPTQTLLPAAGSPAVSAVPAAACSGSGVSTDQRGTARGAGAYGNCTSGSVEVAQATPPTPPPSYNPNGYRLVADEGGIFDFGLNFNGSLANNHLNAPIVGIANSPGPNGYLMVGSDGGVFALGGANFYGGLGGTALASPIAAIAATPSEAGYWLAAQNGKIYNFGATPALSALSLPPGAHIVGMASDNTGQGAWLVDQLGDVYAVGDALYEGGLGGVHINAPIVGIAAAANGQGYVLVASDGGVFNYNMGFFGSVPGSLKAGQSLAAPIVGIAVTHSGNGYWEVGSDGGVFNYGDAPFLGSIYTAIPGQKLNGPIVGIQHLGAPPA